MQIDWVGKSLDMFPDFASNDFLDKCNADTKLFSDVALKNFCFRHLSDLYDLLRSQFGAWVRFAAQVVAVIVATLSHTISGVVLVRTSKQVVRVNASGIVAFMANQKAGWYSTIVKRVGITMRSHYGYTVPKLAITKASSRSFPRPTGSIEGWVNGTVLVNFGPKSFFYGKRGGKGTVQSGLMTGNKSHRLSLDVSVLLAVFGGKWSKLTTATLTKTARVGAGIRVIHSVSLSLKSRLWMASGSARDCFSVANLDAEYIISRIKDILYFGMLTGVNP